MGVPRMTGHSIIPGLSITMVIWSLSYPSTPGTLTFIIMNPTGSTEMPPRPLMSGMDPPIFLGQIVQGHDVHSPLLGIGGRDEVELSSIVQETGNKLIINKYLTQILRAYEPVECIRVQIRGPLHFGRFV